MKKVHFLYLVSLLLLFWSCNNEMMDLDVPINTDALTRIAGDGENDLLGHGYDATSSVFKGSKYGKASIIDLERFLSGKGRDPITGAEVTMYPGNIEKSLLPSGGETYIEWGSNLEEYSKGQHSRYNANTEINALGVKLYSADLKAFYNDSSRFSSSYCFYRINVQKTTRKLKLSQIYPAYLKYFLTDDFLHDLKYYTGDDIVAKYGTHVLTDILLGGVCSAMFNAKMTTAANESSFKNEADLFIRQVSVGTGSSEAQKRFSSFKDVSISIVSYGGKDAIDQSNISFDPSKGELGDFTLNFNNWLNSIDQTTEQVIGIGDNTTKIYFISDLVDDASKKKEIEDAIVRYCEKQQINMSLMQTLDYEKAILHFTHTDNKKYTPAMMYIPAESYFPETVVLNYYPMESSAPLEMKESDMWKFRWTFYPYGEYYRIGIRGANFVDYAFTVRSLSTLLPRFNEKAFDQLWAVEAVSIQNNKYMLRHVNSGQYLSHDDLLLHPKNPNDQSLWFDITIVPQIKI